MGYEQELYQLLELDQDATPTNSEINNAYKKLSLQYHPDKQSGKTEEEQQSAKIKFQQISAAKDVLNDPEQLQQYKEGRLQITETGGLKKLPEPRTQTPQPSSSPEQGASFNPESTPAGSVVPPSNRKNAQVAPAPQGNQFTTPLEAGSEESNQNEEAGENKDEKQTAGQDDVRPKMANNPSSEQGNSKTMLDVWIQMMNTMFSRGLDHYLSAQSKQEDSQPPKNDAEVPENAGQSQQNSQQSSQGVSQASTPTDVALTSVQPKEDMDKQIGLTSATPDAGLVRMTPPASTSSPSTELLALADNALVDRESLQQTQQQQLQQQEQPAAKRFKAPGG
ncbi:J domain-containing protein [Legionella yabuuchiae]|uniref:J domain-containing protein n=1 Tax=Legionella yabuuchiae TaxID=376727 RepID=UPI001055E94C|nr:J domain-containing protein [Legionella yabuuchiae]